MNIFQRALLPVGDAINTKKNETSQKLTSYRVFFKTYAKNILYLPIYWALSNKEIIRVHFILTDL